MASNLRIKLLCRLPGALCTLRRELDIHCETAKEMSLDFELASLPQSYTVLSSEVYMQGEKADLVQKVVHTITQFGADHSLASNQKAISARSRSRPEVSTYTSLDNTVVL
jgi:hypothetical protein